MHKIAPYGTSGVKSLLLVVACRSRRCCHEVNRHFTHVPHHPVYSRPTKMAATQQLTSLFGSRLSSAYNQLRGDLGVPQTATDTIDKLVERIQTSPAVEDRRTAVLGLKGLSRDWREVRSCLLSLVS